MKNACHKFPEIELTEFTVAPNVAPLSGLPRHEWYIEFANAPNDMSAFKKELNSQMQLLNAYYDDLITGAILGELHIYSIRNQGFIEYMKSIGKLGGQIRYQD